MRIFSRFPLITLLISILSLTIVGISLALSANEYNAIRKLTGTGGIAHVLGQFLHDDGNAGTLSFGVVPSDSDSTGAHLNTLITPQVLTGSFWSETIGWINFQDVHFSLTNTGQGLWSLSGYAWNDQAGWIDLSRVTYSLGNTSFSGYAWNDGIGWINMQGATFDLTSSGSIGKVKVIGNLGGNRIFNTTYSLDGKISPATITKMLNEVRKNIALLSRNLPTDKKNTTLDSNRIFDTPSGAIGFKNTLFFENTDMTPARINYARNIKARYENIGNTDTPIYSVIAIGADVYIDDTVSPQSDEKPRTIIALKNNKGVGGNIYINGNITKIKTSLVAEGSLYSAEFSPVTSSTPSIYNNNPNNLFKIPNRQLYVYGTIISNNTIGGYIADNPGANNFCPYNITPCDDQKALTYDFNHFRDFQKNAQNAVLLRGYKDASLDAYSMVIEYDPRLLSDPPPGLERINQ